MIIGTLIVFASAFFCAFVAKAKGRSGLDWWFLGLFFPIISLLALIALPALSTGGELNLER